MNVYLYEQALEAYNKALAFDPGNVKLLYYKAMALAFLHRFDKSKAIIQMIRDVGREAGNEPIEGTDLAIIELIKELER